MTRLAKALLAVTVGMCAALGETASGVAADLVRSHECHLVGVGPGREQFVHA